MHTKFIHALILVLITFSFSTNLAAQANNIAYQNEIALAKEDLSLNKFVSASKHIELAKSFLQNTSTTPEVEYLYSEVYIGVENFVSTREHLSRFFKIASENNPYYYKAINILKTLEVVDPSSDKKHDNLAPTDIINQEVGKLASEINSDEHKNFFFESNNLSLKERENLRVQNKYYKFSRFPKVAVFGDFLFDFESEDYTWHANLDLRYKFFSVTAGVGLFYRYAYDGNQYNYDFKKVSTPSYSFNLNLTIGHGRFTLNPAIGILMRNEIIKTGSYRGKEYREYYTEEIFKIRSKLSILGRLQPFKSGIFLQFGINASIYDGFDDETAIIDEEDESVTYLFYNKPTLYILGQVGIGISF